MDFGVAVKAFIVNQDKLLLIKRRKGDVHKPGEWDIPGGRLEPGENPFDGLRREAKEEVGLDIDIAAPLEVHHFTRDDGQKITMLIFVCKSWSEKVKLSQEHTDYKWVAPKSGDVPDWLQGPATKFVDFYMGKV